MTSSMNQRIACLGECGESVWRFSATGETTRFLCAGCSRMGVSIGDDRDRQIAALTARVNALETQEAVLVTALEPFANHVEFDGPRIPDGGVISSWAPDIARRLAAIHFRRATSALRSYT